MPGQSYRCQHYCNAQRLNELHNQSLLLCELTVFFLAKKQTLHVFLFAIEVRKYCSCSLWGLTWSVCLCTWKIIKMFTYHKGEFFLPISKWGLGFKEIAKIGFLINNLRNCLINSMSHSILQLQEFENFKCKFQAEIGKIKLDFRRGMREKFGPN